MNRWNRGIALTLLGIASISALLLGGCSKEEKPEPGYYTGPMDKKTAPQAGSKTSGLVQ